MRKIIVSMMVSLDGYIESKNPEEYWHNWDEEMSAYMMEFFSKVDTFIYGRKSYQDMIAYWPPLDDDFARVMNSMPKMVFSRTLEKVTWHATLFRELDANKMKILKEKPGKDMVIFAGADIVRSFGEHHLIDEYRLIVNPLLLGEGKPFFKDIENTTPLKFESAKTFNCGNVLLIYHPVKDN